jgi:DNA helicase-4
MFERYSQGGLPSQIEDDPVYQFAMPQEDPFPYADEQLLFYVALTRARRAVMLYTLVHRVSAFLIELKK